MSLGNLIGTPLKPAECSDTAEIAACTTNLCRIRVQLAALEECKNKFSEEHAAELEPDHTEPPTTPLGSAEVAEVAPVGQPLDAHSCYDRAEGLIRQKLILLLTDVSIEGSADLLEVVDGELERLHWTQGSRFDTACEGFEGRPVGLVLGGLARQYQSIILLRDLSGMDRVRYLGLLRLAYGPTQERDHHHSFYDELTGLTESFTFVRGLPFAQALNRAIEAKRSTLPHATSRASIIAELEDAGI
jgi:hypothetical protein